MKKEIYTISDKFTAHGFNIKRVANGFVVMPWGETDSIEFEDTFVFSTKYQLCKFIKDACANFDIAESEV